MQDSGSNTLASTGFAYGIAAIAAVTVDYAVDVSVKRTYATGPEGAIPSLGVLRHTFHIISREGKNIFRGLGVKSVEFGISYMITGLMAPHIINVIDAMILVKDDKTHSKQEWNSLSFTNLLVQQSSKPLLTADLIVSWTQTYSTYSIGRVTYPVIRTFSSTMQKAGVDENSSTIRDWQGCKENN